VAAAAGRVAAVAGSVAGSDETAVVAVVVVVVVVGQFHDAGFEAVVGDDLRVLLSSAQQREGREGGQAG